MTDPSNDWLRLKVRRLMLACLIAWATITVMPVLIARSGGHLGPWPMDFWMAAQGSVLGYLLIVVLYAWLVNRWEQQAGRLSFRVPPPQDN